MRGTQGPVESVYLPVMRNATRTCPPKRMASLSKIEQLAGVSFAHAIFHCRYIAIYRHLYITTRSDRIFLRIVDCTNFVRFAYFDARVLGKLFQKYIAVVRRPVLTIAANWSISRAYGEGDERRLVP